MSIDKFIGLFHPVSEFFLYILFVSFVRKQKWVYKKKVSVSSIHFISPCFVTSTNHGCRSVSFVSFVTKQDEIDQQSLTQDDNWSVSFVSFCSVHFRVFLIYFRKWLLTTVCQKRFRY